MKLAADPPPKEKAEPTIALINIVFLMLIFFLVAAQVAPPLDHDVSLANTEDLEASPPPDALVILKDGELKFRGTSVGAQDYIDVLKNDSRELYKVRIIPDRELAARALLDVSQDLRSAGAKSIMIVTERALE